MHCIDKVKCWIRKYGWKKMIVKQFSVWIKLNYLVCFRSVECAAVLLNRNRNHRRNNFLRCGTGTRTVTCQKGTGTIINLRFRNRNKMVTLKLKLCIWFPSFNIFTFIFYNKLYETYQFFPRKKSLECKKARFFQFFLLLFNGLDTEPEPLLVKSQNRNRKFSIVGTRTIKNSYGSTTLVRRCT